MSLDNLVWARLAKSLSKERRMKQLRARATERRARSHSLFNPESSIIQG
jgi:hypothetical protein